MAGTFAIDSTVAVMPPLVYPVVRAVCSAAALEKTPAFILVTIVSAMLSGTSIVTSKRTDAGLSVLSVKVTALNGSRESSASAARVAWIEFCAD